MTSRRRSRSSTRRRDIMTKSSRKITKKRGSQTRGSRGMAAKRDAGAAAGLMPETGTLQSFSFYECIIE